MERRRPWTRGHMMPSVSPASRRRVIKTAESVLPRPFMRAMRVAKFRQERRRFSPCVVSHNYGGHPLRIAIGSPYGERYDRDWSELAEVAFLRRHRLRPGARVFNLGANHGVVALMLADVVGSDGLVVALEAHPDDAALCDRNRELNRRDQLLCLNAAVARSSGALSFGMNNEVDDGTARWGEIGVPAWSIDDLARHHGAPDVVFMDVEGYEEEALLGATETLEAGADWFVEVHTPQLPKYGGSAEGVIARFDRTRYDLHVAADKLHFGPEAVVSLTTFMPIEDAPQSLFESRFFLIAIN